MKRSLYITSIFYLLTFISIGIIACPTCVGRIRLGLKKPFFKVFNPDKKKSNSKKDKKQKPLVSSLSFKSTDTSQKSL